MTKFTKDLIERTLATAAVAALGFLVIHAGDINAAYAIPIATALTVLKGSVAKFVGDPESASLSKSV